MICWRSCRPATYAGQSAANPCRVLPALTLGYQLATNQDNTSSSRTQVLHLQVGHVGYNGAGSHAPITSAAVWVSFNGGRSWQRASLTGSAGDYTATWPNPASARGTRPDIKVTAADSAGGSITQTVTAAYTIATPRTRVCNDESVGNLSGRGRSNRYRQPCERSGYSEPIILRAGLLVRLAGCVFCPLGMGHVSSDFAAYEMLEKALGQIY